MNQSDTASMPQAKPAAPKKHRMALLVFVGVYPLVTVLLSVLGPLTVGWEVWERTLVLVPIMVFVILYGLIPFIQKNFRSFLMGK